MTIVWNILTILGALGIFLFGIKMLSEALQKVVGSRMRLILSAITANKYRSIFTGLLITSLIQSSSASSVLIISFVNAGLLSLYQAVGALIGANIGTTITLWIISLLGFKISLNLLLLPIIAISLPFYFSSKSLFKSWGEVLIGFALLFMGLELIKLNFPVLDENSMIVNKLAQLTNLRYFSVLLYLLVGIIFTFLLQSSSVTLALTLVMCNNGWITFELAAAMVLGINIGTTSTAIIASLITNQTSRKAAVSHLLFNVLGVIWALAFFPYLLRLVDYLTILFEGESARTSLASIPIALSLLHSIFNVVTAILVSSFMTPFIRLVDLFFRGTKKPEQFKLTYLKSAITTSELSVLQAGKEIQVFGERTVTMFDFIPKLLIEKNEEEFQAIYERTQHYEKTSDSLEKEIADYLGRLSESEISERSSKRILAMLAIIDELESINDICMKIARLINKKNDDKAWFNQKMRNEIGEIFNLTRMALELMNKHIENLDLPVDLNRAYELESEINQTRKRLIEKNKKRLDAEKINYQAANYFEDFVNLIEEVADLALNINQTIAEFQKD